MVDDIAVELALAARLETETLREAQEGQNGRGGK
jgi:hypothetical protein